MGAARIVQLHKPRPTSQLSRIINATDRLLVHIVQRLHAIGGRQAEVIFLRAITLTLSTLVRAAAARDRRQAAAKPADMDALMQESQELINNVRLLLKRIDDEPKK